MDQIKNVEIGWEPVQLRIRWGKRDVSVIWPLAGEDILSCGDALQKSYNILHPILGRSIETQGVATV